MPPHVIQGREVPFPVKVRDASSAAATYLVPTGPARALLPDSVFEPAELLPGFSLFSIACVDYRDNDLGDYNEVSFALFVRRRDEPPLLPYLGTLLHLLRSRVSTYIVWLPVDQEFTRDAGETIWGFPKTVETIDLEHGGGTVTCRLEGGGRHVMTFSMAAAGRRQLAATELETYTHIGGQPYLTRFRSAANGVGLQLGGARLELGDHPFAEQLRSLGLPSRPLMSVWMEHMQAVFEPPVRIGSHPGDEDAAGGG